MEPLGNDRWRGEFGVDALGSYRYTVAAWVDPLLSWRHDFARRVDADDMRVAALIGAELIETAAQRAGGDDRDAMLERVGAARCARPRTRDALTQTLALDEARAALAERYPDRRSRTPIRSSCRSSSTASARASRTWYELFPRSTARKPGAPRHVSRLRGAAAVRRRDGLRRAVPAADPSDRARAAQGHEQRARRRARRRRAARGRSARPRAGTRRSIRQLGTLEDFRRLVSAAARARHRDRARHRVPVRARPSLRQASIPEWFRWRPDGTRPVRREPAEEVPGHLSRSTSSATIGAALWQELQERVRVLDRRRRDGSSASTTRTPRRSAFWEWAIAEVKRDHPDVIFLAEAFTRPKVMHRLAKLGLHAVLHVLHLAQHEAAS